MYTHMKLYIRIHINSQTDTQYVRNNGGLTYNMHVRTPTRNGRRRRIRHHTAAAAVVGDVPWVF